MSDPGPTYGPPRRRGDWAFPLIGGGLSGSYVLLILLLIGADLCFVSFSEFLAALRQEEIQAAAGLTILTCTLSAVMSLWVAIPLGYFLARSRGRWAVVVDTIVDVPLVLPPLILGLSLLILFHLPIGGRRLEDLLRDGGFPVAFEWPAVVLAQFSVAGAFAIRTMRVTFDQIDRRPEDVARTLGCNRGQAFLRVALPQAWRGALAAGTVAWARSLGEFGPILVFAGATRMKTEVLSTTVFLELSVGNLDAAVAVSLVMVAAAVFTLILLRALGARSWDMRGAGS
ncbi:MAG: ABC transporter permease [Planctomycetota bacterium]